VQRYTWLAKLILEISGLFKYLYAMIVGVSHNNIFIHAKTETMWRVKLSFPRTQLAKLASKNYTKMHKHIQL